ncbi:pilus assembly protein TadG-related protein [Tepidibacillus sp. HK-1]|uniref:pilus assembly protein TadG-related protein n=1 Tax=Tepidibacillus sp. HK-1 TaxID=1883407 RepID=UPI00085370F7|nr:pilus assembly protein TadG-related protein [Tepidibacillus sp. HK-1]GBF10520.1 hypothetical protein HK1_00532 [Tepidibacillus sp. HK-1]
MNERGSVAVLLLLFMTILLAMAALVVDIGYLMIENQRLGDALDAAALAGVQELVKDPDQAKAIAIQYANENGVNQPEVIIDLEQNQVTVKGERTVPFFFAKAIGFKEKTITASSTAQIKQVSGGYGFVPLGVVQQSFHYGELYTLKYDPTEATNGNFGALALGGTGASNYLQNLKNGYQGKLEIGMKIPTETGNMSGPTRKGIEDRMESEAGNDLCEDYQTAPRDCNRILYLPVIDSLDVNGRNEVTIVGFAAFYLEGFTGNGNESRITGRFIKTLYSGDWISSGENQFGLYAVKLVR